MFWKTPAPPAPDPHPDKSLYLGKAYFAEFDPEEDVFMELDVPVKVVALRWSVQWSTC